MKTFADEVWESFGSVVHFYGGEIRGGFDIRNCPDPEERASRISACVNACRGIDTETLETKYVGAHVIGNVLTQGFEDLMRYLRERDDARAMVKRLANALREAANENYRDEWEDLAAEAEDSISPPNVTCPKCFCVWPGSPETCATCGEALHE